MGESVYDVALAQPPGAQTVKHAVDLGLHGLELHRRRMQHRAHRPEKHDEMPVAELRRALAARVVFRFAAHSASSISLVNTHNSPARFNQ